MSCLKKISLILMLGSSIALGNMKSAEGLPVVEIHNNNQTQPTTPNSAITYYDRGVAKSQLGDYLEAIEDYTQAIKINPNYAIAF